MVAGTSEVPGNEAGICGQVAPSLFSIDSSSIRALGSRSSSEKGNATEKVFSSSEITLISEIESPPASK